MIFHNFEYFCEQFTELFTILKPFVKKSDMQFFLCWSTCSNKFPVSQFFSDVSHIIFYPDQSGSMSLAFPIPLSLAIDSCEKDLDIRDVESRRIQMLISVVYNTRQVRDRSPSHNSLTTFLNRRRGSCRSLTRFSLEYGPRENIFYPETKER